MVQCWAECVMVLFGVSQCLFVQFTFVEHSGAWLVHSTVVQRPIYERVSINEYAKHHSITLNRALLKAP